MIVAKLTISYDRGLAHNDARDIVADGTKKDIFTRGAKTPDGKIIRGLGTHYRSEQDAQLVQERDKEARRIYNEFRSRFISTTIDGLYVVPQRGVAKKYVESLEVRSDMKVRVTEFELSTHEPLATAEVNEWAQRIKRQLGSISLGRSKEADAEGLRALEALSTCPVISASTGQTIRDLVALVRENKLDRVELKRKIETLDVEIEQKPLSPRRAPVVEDVCDHGYKPGKCPGAACPSNKVVA